MSRLVVRAIKNLKCLPKPLFCARSTLPLACKLPVVSVNYSLKRHFCSESPVCEEEPPYLVHLKPPEPTYELVNLQFRGYDFVVLERFARYVHNLVKRLDINVENAWATPKQSLKVSILKPRSTAVSETIDLSLYERNIQIADFPVMKSPILISLVEFSLPAGVKFSMHHHESAHDEIRYIPDLELKELQEELEDINRK